MGNSELRNKAEIILALVLLVYFALSAIFISFNTPPRGHDEGLEFRNAKNILNYNTLRSGPIIQQILYATFLEISNYDYMSLKLLIALVSLLVILATYIFLRGDISSKSIYISLIFFNANQIFLWGETTLKQYSIYLFFIILFFYSFKIYCRKKHKMNWLILSAFFLSASYMTHIITVFFFIVPIGYFLLSRIFKFDIPPKRLMLFYMFAGLFLLIYLYWRIQNDGMLFYKYPTHWAAKYGVLTNQKFWKLTPPFSIMYYFEFLKRLEKLLIACTLILPLIGIANIRDKILVYVFLLASVGAFLISKAPMRSIYLYPVVPVLIIFTAYGIEYIVKYRVRSPKVLVFILFIVILIGTSIFSCNIMNLKNGIIKENNQFKEQAEYLSSQIDGNVLFRTYSFSPYLNKTVKSIRPGEDFTQKDAITFLKWPSDEEVFRLFIKYNLSYVIICKNVKMEREYYVWFRYLTGTEPVHYVRIRNSPIFEKVTETRNFELYRIKSPS